MIQSFKQKLKYHKAHRQLRIAIVRSKYHDDLTQSMEQACRKTLISSAVSDSNIQTFEVPGSWEIPLVVKRIAQTKKFDGIVALGVIIKGETYHFELIANECAKALMNISLEFDTPITFEVLATFSLEQAKIRSIGKYNKGIEAAKSLVEIIKILKKL